MDIATAPAKHEKISKLFLKKITIFAATFVAALFSGYSFWQIIYLGNLNFYPYLILAVAASAIIFYLSSLVIDSYKFLILLSTTATALFCFSWILNSETYLKNFQISIIAFFASLLFLAAGSRQIKRESNDLLKIRWWRIGRRGLKYFFWAITIIIAISLYFSPYGKLELLLNQDNFNKLLNSSTPVIKMFFLDFSWDATIDDLIENQLQRLLSQSKESSKEIYLKQLSELGISPDYVFKKEGPEKLSAAMGGKSPTIEQYKKDLSEKLGIKISGNEKINELAYNLTFSRYYKFSPKIQNYTTIIIIALISLTVKSVSIILIWLILIVGFLIYELLISNGFLVIKTENAIKEKVEL